MAEIQFLKSYGYQISLAWNSLIKRRYISHAPMCVLYLSYYRAYIFAWRLHFSWYEILVAWIQLLKICLDKCATRVVTHLALLALNLEFARFAKTTSLRISTLLGKFYHLQSSIETGLQFDATFGNYFNHRKLILPAKGWLSNGDQAEMLDYWWVTYYFSMIIQLTLILFTIKFM